MRNYITRYSLLLLAVSSLILSSCKGKKMDQPEKAFGIASYYETVFEDGNSNHEVNEVIVVESQEKLEELFGQINSTRKPGVAIPEVNFKKETLIFAYAGQKNSGGYYLDITKVEDEEDRMHFTFEVQRQSGDMATMSITTPVKVIKVEHQDKKITASI